MTGRRRIKLLDRRDTGAERWTAQRAAPPRGVRSARRARSRRTLLPERRERGFDPHPGLVCARILFNESAEDLMCARRRQNTRAAHGVDDVASSSGRIHEPCDIVASSPPGPASWDPWLRGGPRARRVVHGLRCSAEQKQPPHRALLNPRHVRFLDAAPVLNSSWRAESACRRFRLRRRRRVRRHRAIGRPLRDHPAR